MARKADETISLKLRFPERLRRQLEKAAAQNSRSMNSEIIQRLEDSFRDKLDVQEIIKIAVAEAVGRTLAHVDQEREKAEAALKETRPFSDLFKPTGEEK